MRVHKNNIRDGEVIPGAFKNQPEGKPGSGMSTNWAKYSSVEQVREGARQPAENYAVIELSPVGRIRDIESQSVVHTPMVENRSHTDVFGEKTPETRLKLLALSQKRLNV